MAEVKAYEHIVGGKSLLHLLAGICIFAIAPDNSKSVWPIFVFLASMALYLYLSFSKIMEMANQADKPISFYRGRLAMMAMNYFCFTFLLIYQRFFFTSITVPADAVVCFLCMIIPLCIYASFIAYQASFHSMPGWWQKIYFPE